MSGIRVEDHGDRLSVTVAHPPLIPWAMVDQERGQLACPTWDCSSLLELQGTPAGQLLATTDDEGQEGYRARCPSCLRHFFVERMPTDYTQSGEYEP